MDKSALPATTEQKRRSSVRIGLVIGALVLAWYLAAMWMMQP